MVRKVNSLKERAELLSSPFIIAESTKEDGNKGEVDEDQGPDEEEETKEPSTAKMLQYEEPIYTTTSRRSHSPLRVRDRLSALFKNKGSVDEYLKSVADAEDKECHNGEDISQIPYVETSQSGEPELRIDLDPTNTVKSDETRGSSLINEQQTYYNTIRNSFITQEVPMEHSLMNLNLDKSQGFDEDQIPLKELPPSRIFLSIYPEQKDLFKLNRELIRNNTKDYDLMYKWSLITDSLVLYIEEMNGNSNFPNDVFNTTKRRKLQRASSISRKGELNEIIVKYHDEHLKKLNKNFEIHLFKDGMEPKINSDKQSHDLFRATVAIQVSDLHCLLWKKLTQIVLDDKFIDQEDPNVYVVKNMIYGLTFILKDTKKQLNGSNAQDKVLLVKLWLSAPRNPGGISAYNMKERAVELCEMLLYNIREPLIQAAISEAKYFESDEKNIENVFNIK